MEWLRQNRWVLVLVLSALAATVLLMAVFAAVIYGGLSTPIIPSSSWQIAGCVLDHSSNALANVEIAVSGTRQVSGVNKVFGTKPPRFSLRTQTDVSGCFVVKVEAAYLQLSFSKEGYASKTLVFHRTAENGGDKTSQNVSVILDLE